MAAIVDPKKVERTLNQLERVKELTRVEADTGDFATLKEFAPQDATTNPTLIFKAAQMPEYRYLIDQALTANKEANLSKDALAWVIVDHLLVLFGLEILKIIPGRVSTE